MRDLASLLILAVVLYLGACWVGVLNPDHGRYVVADALEGLATLVRNGGGH